MTLETVLIPGTYSKNKKNLELYLVVLLFIPISYWYFKNKWKNILG